MRPAFVASRFIVGCVLLVMGSVALAQESPLGGRVQAIVGPAHAVPRGPQYVAVGDIDNDGRLDAAISCTTDDNVVSALSAGDGTFDTLVTFPVGKRIGDLALLFANTDNCLDVATTDLTISSLGGGVFTTAGSCDGRYGVPSFIDATTRAASVVIADFDGKNGSDIATANGRRINFQTKDDDVTIILNRGQNRGFEPGIPYSVGTRTQPEDIETADFDGDGDMDLVVLDTDPRNTDEVVVMPNNGLAQFLTVTNYVTGLGGAAMAVKDYNDDRIPDIAVVNDDTVRRAYSISVLLNGKRTVNGQTKGTGVFTVLSPVVVSCPSKFNGIPINCFMKDIQSADFNRDGLNDLVISIDTRTQDDLGITTPGILSFYEGLGDGSFAFSTSVNVGAGASGIDVGDVTGDAAPDVVVAEFRDNTVTIVRSVPPPKRPDGGQCRISDQCESGACVDGFCCESASCSDGKRCDIPNHEGTCTDPGDPGDHCSKGEQCDSGFCVDGFCCTTRDCPDGQYCNTGTCGPPAENGTNCNADEQCASMNCVDGVCCAAESCPVGQRCDIPGKRGTCNATLDLGEACTDDGQCTSGNCTDGVCCNVADCGPGQACNISPNEGGCSLLPTPTATPTATPTPQPNGFPCERPGQCSSGFCVDGTCCGTANCPPNQYCNISDANGECSPRHPIDHGCNQDADCQTGNCDLTRPDRPAGYAGICGPVRTPTPKGPGDTCNETSECKAGFECNVKEGGICCEELECPEGTSCRVPGSAGFCRLLPTPTPTRLPNGERCSVNSPEVCQSGNCVDNRCCQDAQCAGTDRCDIFGYFGRCVPPLQEGEVCEKASDCEVGLVCANDTGTGLRCTLRQATPSPIPTDKPTATPGTTKIVSRDSGGCNIDHGSNNGSTIWMLMTLPMFLFVRRAQLAPSRAKRR